MVKPWTAADIDMSVWAGREDPEADSLRWHQCIRPIDGAGANGVALLGFASDAGVRRNHGRPGAAGGPRALRKALAPLAWHRNAPIYDAGDVSCHGHGAEDGMEAAQDRLAERVAKLLDAGHFPLVLGGGHEMAYASWSGLARHFTGATPPRIGIINLDAHFDLRDPAHGRSSGTSFAQIAAECAAREWSFRYACLGISRAANTRALFRRARELGVWLREDHDICTANLATLGDELQAFTDDCEHLYLSIDLDVLPASEAPGVSAPAAHGVSLPLVECLVRRIVGSGKLRLVDIAELNPDFDNDGRTAKAAARLVHQLTLDD